MRNGRARASEMRGGYRFSFVEHTVRPGNLAPDDADLGTADLLGSPVNVGNLLSEVETARTHC
jgi:hypothetical protein